MNIRVIYLFSCFLGIHGTNFSICEDNKTPPLALRVLGCEVPPCKLAHSQNATFDIDFEAAEDLIKLRPHVKARAMGVDADYPIPQQDACLGITNGECPLDKGEEVTYRLLMPILESFPKISFQAEFSLMSSDKTVCCFKLIGEVVDP